MLALLSNKMALSVADELAGYEVTPSVVPADAESVVRICPQGSHAAFTPDCEYIVQFLPYLASREFYPVYNDYDIIKVKPEENGDLAVRYAFKGEQEYYIRVFKPEDVAWNEDQPNRRYHKSLAWLTFHVYALKPDLYALRPFRGDFHAHSTASDGHESPEIVAANYRKNGFDFFGLTDHHRYWPSVQAQNAFAEAPIDLKIIRGEEVHPPGNYVHIVNFGGRWSVNTLCSGENQAEYEKQVREIITAETMPDNGLDPFYYASALWAFRKIKAAAGLAIFPHPHWLADVCHVPQTLTDALFASGEFDAFELLGGQTPYENNMQTAYYNEAISTGKRIAIVGSSDSHSSEIGGRNAHSFTWISTVLFAKDTETETIIEAVKDLRSVAVEAYPGEESRVYGPYRLVLYTQFLLKYYFPAHDELCFEEGRLMREWLFKKENAEALLTLMQGRVGKLQERFFGKA